MKMEQKKFDFTGASVLEKFKAVKIKEDRLSPEDKAVIERYQEQYSHIAENLDKYEALFEALNEGCASPPGKYMYSPGKGLRELSELRANAIKDFVIDVIYYFNRTYRLNIKGFEFLYGKDDLKSEDILRYVVSTLHGLSFIEKGKQNLIIDLRKNIWEQKNAKLQGKKITFKNYFCIVNNYSKQPTFNYGQREEAQLLASVISYFETGVFNEITLLAGKIKNDDELLGEEQVIDSGKVRAFKFFKNGSVSFTFDSVETAKEFWELFELGHFPERIKYNY